MDAPGLSVFEMVDVRVGPGKHKRHFVRVRPAHVVRRRSVLVMESDDLPVALGSAGRRAFDDELVAEVSSHDAALSSEWCCIQRATRDGRPHGTGQRAKATPPGSRTAVVTLSR